MARRVAAIDEAPRQTVQNPDLFGEDLVPLAYEALGVGLAAYGNDKIVAPIARQVVPISTGTGGKLFDALTTAATGWAAGEVISMASSPIGRRVRRGGVLLGVAKALSAFIPGFAISAQFPALPFPAASSNGNGKKAEQLSAANATPLVTARLGVGTMGL